MHHDLDLEVSTSPKPKPKFSTNTTYGSMRSSSPRDDNHKEYSDKDNNSDDEDDETSHLLQLKLERAAAQVKGVSMLSFSPSRGMPEAYRSMDDLDAPRKQMHSPSSSRRLDTKGNHIGSM